MSAALSISEHDHVRGPRDAQVVMIEYGDFQCPYCARAHATLSQLQRQHRDRLTLVYRHLPLADLHPFAEAGAQAAEAAGAQGKFWQMHDALFENQATFDPGALAAMAASLQLDVGRFTDEVESARHRKRVDRQADEARSLGARGTPTFFINGERYHGDSDHASLTAAIEQALAGKT